MVRMTRADHCNHRSHTHAQGYCNFIHRLRYQRRHLGYREVHHDDRRRCHDGMLSRTIYNLFMVYIGPLYYDSTLT